jgi:glycosyltransferase involved in cell wall biosynthesis
MTAEVGEGEIPTWDGSMAPKILHLSSFDLDAGNGAARGSLWLHKAIRGNGFDSSMIVGSKRSDDPSIASMPGPIAPIAAKLRMRLDRLPLRHYTKTSDSFWTIGWLPCHFDRLMAEVDPDIVHLHWVGAGFLSIQALRQFKRPIVWTMRDMWTFTGGCHYTAGCEHYRERCGRCPQLQSDEDDDLSRTVWERKWVHWQGLDLWLVPISNWLGDCARSSALLESYPIDVIPNGLDTARFRPIPRSAARDSWQLPLDRDIVVYGAVHATRDSRKGFSELVAALRLIAASARPQKPLLVVFGRLEPGDVPDVGIEVRYAGYVDDDDKLAHLYSGADVAVMPSLQEAFGKTLIEAMACGTPTVAFDSGGPRDIITHRIDGYLAKPFEPGDLAEGIGWCLDELSKSDDLARRARRKVETQFDIRVIAERYQALYRRILGSEQAQGGGRAPADQEPELRPAMAPVNLPKSRSA